MDVSRRDFIKLGSGAAMAGTAVAQATPAPAAPMLLTPTGPPLARGFDPADPALKYDLVIAGGDVLDPSQRLRRVSDVAIKNGQIAAVGSTIPPDRSVQRIDARGKLVTPGLID